MSNNDAQRSGLAYVYQASDCKNIDGLVKTTTTTLAGVTSSGCWESKKKRWFTASDATAGVVAANAQADAYAALKTTYEGDATKYNKYLADLKTANEKDAFAAAFAPPEKPAMVVRPAKPEVPAVYAGMNHWSAAS
jgi:hypothetical protein